MGTTPDMRLYKKTSVICSIRNTAILSSAGIVLSSFCPDKDNRYFREGPPDLQQGRIHSLVK
jgi:hypothetical protein